MSKIVKGAGKVFKKVVRVTKKVLPYALGAAAIVFTAGAALGVAGMAGGWSAAAASIGTTIGGTGTLGTVLTGAITQAGIGAATGAGLAAVTGKNIGKGVRTGAAIGAATGAATGLLAPGAVNMKTLGQANAPVPAGTTTVGQGAGKITVEPLKPAAAAETTVATAPNAALNSVGQAPPPSGLAGVVERHPVLASSALQAAGTGLLAASQPDNNASEERAAVTRENYGDPSMYTGLLRRDDVRTDTTARPRPEERFNTSFQYKWDPEQRRLVKVATTT